MVYQAPKIVIPIKVTFNQWIYYLAITLAVSENSNLQLEEPTFPGSRPRAVTLFYRQSTSESSCSSSKQVLFLSYKKDLSGRNFLLLVEGERSKGFHIKRDLERFRVRSPLDPKQKQNRIRFY